MIEDPTPCITVSVEPNHKLLAASKSFRELVHCGFDEDQALRCADVMSCSGKDLDACHGESCPLVKVYRSEDKFLQDVPVRLRTNGALLPTTAQFCALWEPWGSYVSVWFGPADAYE